jgi:sulfur-oxidizing protein SoxX
MLMRLTVLAALLALATPAAAQQANKADAAKVDVAKIDAALKAAFPSAPADWAPRFNPDETMRECSANDNTAPKAASDAIANREKAKIVYPPDGKFIGDWKKGEKLAQSGYGLRFTDYPPKGENGGNCYGCHQLSKAEVSYGTVGPSLLGYGKARDYSAADIKAVYEHIYDPQAAHPCSNMPRFGVNKVLTIEQIKDAVALLMSPDSPVNK